MFCTQCGTKAVSDAKFCANCGASLSINTVQTEMKLQQTLKSEVHSNLTNKDTKAEPTGVGGWLWLLIVGMVVLGPLAGAGQIYDEIIKLEEQYPSITSIAAWKSYKSWTWWQYIFFSGMSIYGGHCLVRDRNLRVVNQAKAILWMTGPLAELIMAVIFVSIIGNSEFNESRFIGGLLASIIVASIWTVYLSKSKRVRNTYREG